MVSPVILAVFIGSLIYGCYKYCVYRPSNFPPGPFRIPVFGSYLFLLLIDKKRLHVAIEKLCKFYKSTVVGFYTGDTLTVVANDAKSIREILFNPDFDGRNDFFITRLREPNFKLKGIFFTDGGFWSEQRRFTLRNLRDFGFGRRFEDFEMEVRDEMKALVSMIKSGPMHEHEKAFLRPNGEICLPKILIGSLGNCFLQVIANERLPRAEQGKLFKSGYGSMAFQIHSNEYGKLFSILPWIRFLFPKASSFKQLREGSMEMCRLMEEIIERQINTFEEGSVRNFIDVYIKEMKQDEKAVNRRGFMIDQLLMVCTDFVFPSLSAMETQIAFLFKHLLHRKDVLMKIQSEIHSVVGSGRLPELNDRVNMPYTEASLREILRIETLAPSSIPHRALRDTTLAGFQIPKDTIVQTGLYAMHMDEAIWGDPDNFKPERFLNEDGSFNIKKDFSLPFGAGRRICAGETFARHTMFLCIAALLQNFDLKTIAGKLPDHEDTDCGIARMPRDFWVKLESK